MLHVHRCIPSHPIPPLHPITKVRNIREMHGERLIKLMGFLSLRCGRMSLMRPVDSRQLIIYIYSIRISWGVMNAYDHVIDDAKWNYSNTLSWRIIYHFIFKRTDFNKGLFGIHMSRSSLLLFRGYTRNVIWFDLVRYHIIWSLSTTSCWRKSWLYILLLLDAKCRLTLGSVFFTTCESPYGHIGLTWYL